MLWSGNKRIAQIWVGKKPIATLWRGAVKVWEAIRSCFGKGYWINDKPWSDTDGWKN